MRRALVLAFLALLSCSDSLKPEDFYGVWGAEGVRLTLSSTQWHFETSCWSGDLVIPLQVDRNGFNAVGTVNRQGGAGGMESRVIEAFGSQAGGLMYLAIEPGSIGLGPYVLERDAQVSIPGCP